LLEIIKIKQLDIFLTNSFKSMWINWETLSWITTNIKHKNKSLNTYLDEYKLKEIKFDTWYETKIGKNLEYGYKWTPHYSKDKIKKLYASWEITDLSEIIVTNPPV
jgi:hypothetical protein